jgi:hypothetical protein
MKPGFLLVGLSSRVLGESEHNMQIYELRSDAASVVAAMRNGAFTADTPQAVDGVAPVDIERTSLIGSARGDAC